MSVLALAAQFFWLGVFVLCLLLLFVGGFLLQDSRSAADKIAAPWKRHVRERVR